MAESAKKVLFVNSEIHPYVPETEISLLGRNLPHGIQELRHEIRSFMPRYGCINERKNQLHEVIRLSGMNIIIGDVDRPLVIKVASIASARLQVYFIDNEDYFKRKFIYTDAEGNYFPDNGERAIFFARGVLETVKKLRWAPDIIHCNGWISQLLPVYLKKIYKDDPIFSNSKIVLSLYGDTPQQAFSPDFRKTVAFGQLKPEDINLPDEVTGMELAKFAAGYADGVIIGSDKVEKELCDFVRTLPVPVLPFDAKAREDGSEMEQYNSLYEKI